jgi:predicted nucleic acid-binding protein
MLDAVSNTSPLLYLHRIGLLHWLPILFASVRIPQAVLDEFEIGRNAVYDVPDLTFYDWPIITSPTSIPIQWQTLELGPGELAAMALAQENPNSIVLLDDLLARRTAQAAGLTAWGTLKILLEGKARGLTEQVGPHLTALTASGMWLTEELRRRILVLADEWPES